MLPQRDSDLTDRRHHSRKKSVVQGCPEERQCPRCLRVLTRPAANAADNPAQGVAPRDSVGRIGCASDQIITDVIEISACQPVRGRRSGRGAFQI